MDANLLVSALIMGVAVPIAIYNIVQGVKTTRLKGLTAQQIFDRYWKQTSYKHAADGNLWIGPTKGGQRVMVLMDDPSRPGRYKAVYDSRVIAIGEVPLQKIVMFVIEHGDSCIYNIIQKRF